MGASPKPIRVSEPILVDFGTCYWGYHSDQTRCFSLGRIPRILKKAYEVCREIMETLAREARPGVSCQTLYRMARALAEQRGFGNYFMGPESYQTRFVGHGIGLEISEPPYIAEGHDYPLEENVTLCLEPKMVIPGLGAIGIENTYLVTQEGLKPLTVIPEELLEF